MAKVNTYGLKISGLRGIAGRTKGLRGFYDSYYLQLFYDQATGEAWTTEHVSLGHNSQMVIHDPDVVNCGFLWEPLTMQQLADRIRESVLGGGKQ